jgi:hypothetical protein
MVGGMDEMGGSGKTATVGVSGRFEGAGMVVEESG